MTLGLKHYITDLCTAEDLEKGRQDRISATSGVSSESGAATRAFNTVSPLDGKLLVPSNG